MNRPDRLDVLLRDHLAPHRVADQLLQLHPDILHIIPGPLHKILHDLARDLLPVLCEDPCRPAHELIRILLL